jgi:pentatricopeptide repeat protein
MSNIENEIWAENKMELGYCLFQEGEFEKAEEVAKELREVGFEKEANKLEQDLNEERDLRFAQEKGSEDGMDSLSDL